MYKSVVSSSYHVQPIIEACQKCATCITDWFIH